MTVHADGIDFELVHSKWEQTTTQTFLTILYPLE